MSEGLSFNGISKIEIRKATADGSLGEIYKVEREGKLVEGVMEGENLANALSVPGIFERDVEHEKNGEKKVDTFDLHAGQVCLDNITEAVDIVVYYSAIVNEKAKIAGEVNPNGARLTYGENNETEESTTKTYVYKFDLHKYAKGAAANTNLAGAKFRLLSSNQVYINLVKLGDNEYRVATADEIKKNIDDEIVTNDKGMITIKGLDIGKYFLKETEAPSGYNKLEELVEVNITRENESADANGTYIVNNDGDTHKVDVENSTGSLLPSTGGIGTTIFYLVGGLLIIGAFVSFIVRRKLNDCVLFGKKIILEISQIFISRISGQMSG